jgi:hypothetical protein
VVHTPGRQVISFPDFEIEFKPFLFQQYAPVNEKKCSDYKQTDDGRNDALHGKRAVNEAAGISDSVTSGQNHHGVTDEFAEEKRRDNLHRLDFGNTRRREEHGRGQRRECVDENEEPASPRSLAEFFPDEFEVLVFPALDEFV